MNTDTGNNNDTNKLQGAFGDRGMNVNSMTFMHPHTDDILSKVSEVLRESESGKKLMLMLDKKQVPVSIMKGKGESGYSPQMDSIILQVPGNVKSAQGEHVIQLAKALHEATQEHAGLKTPDMGKDLLAYASFIHSRNLDSTIYVCKIINELTNSSYYSVLLDSLAKIGLNNLYKAYTEGKTRDELYKYYAEAYETLSEGV